MLQISDFIYSKPEFQIVIYPFYSIWSMKLFYVFFLKDFALTFIILAFEEVKYHFVLIADKYNVIICLNASVLFVHVWNPFWFESS